jgi:hypothetical protein
VRANSAASWSVLRDATLRVAPQDEEAARFHQTAAGSRMAGTIPGSSPGTAMTVKT